MGPTRSWASAVKQVCIVVQDCDATIRDFHDTAGIGPWSVWVPKLTDTYLRGVPCRYTMKLALAWTQDFMFEVIQPLEGPSIYREFLEARGEGFHHILVQSDGYDFDELLRDATARGCPPIMGGKWSGAEFAYLDASGPLKMAVEVFRAAPDRVRPVPDYTYPPSSR